MKLLTSSTYDPKRINGICEVMALCNICDISTVTSLLNTTVINIKCVIGNNGLFSSYSIFRIVDEDRTIGYIYHSKEKSTYVDFSKALLWIDEKIEKDRYIKMKYTRMVEKAQKINKIKYKILLEKKTMRLTTLYKIRNRILNRGIIE